jgi:predicted dehydrogenase
VRLKSSYLVREPLPSFIIHGYKGSFIKSRADIQEGLLIAGAIVDPATWGKEPESEKGLLHTEKNGSVIREKIETERGNYGEYYHLVQQAIRENKAPPVSGEQGINVMKIIELAQESNKQKKVVNVN